MTKVSNPKVNITKSPATTDIANVPQQVLIVGQQGSGSIYTTGELVESIANSDAAINNFGRDSHIAQMLRAFKAINQETRVDVIPLDDSGTAVDAEGVFTITGPATEAGTLIFYAGSKKNNKYTIAVADTDTATDIGDALEAAITADLDAPFSAVNAIGVVTLTAKNGGTIYNSASLEVSGIVAGVAVALTAFTSGANDPVITTLFDVVADTRYQTVIYPSTYDIDELTTNFLDGRWNVDNQILDGVGVISKTDTLANLKTYLGLRNSQSLIVHSNLLVDATTLKGSAIVELDDAIASMIGAIRALRLTDDANISRYVIASNLDIRGGTQAASLPYFNTPFFNLEVIGIGQGFLDTEITEINDAGGFVIGNNVARSAVICGQVYTTYKTDVAANPDTTYQFLNLVDTFSNVAEFIFNNLRADYAQYRLTDGAVTPGYNIANSDSIRASLIEYYQTLSGAGYLLTRGGQDNVKFFSENLTITLDLENGKVSSIAEVPLVVQLRELDVILKAVFDTN